MKHERYIDRWSFDLPNTLTYVRDSTSVLNVIRREYEPIIRENDVLTEMNDESDSDWIIRHGGLTIEDYIAEANCGGHIP